MLGTWILKDTRMSLITSAVSLGVGLTVGEGIADAVTEDDNILGHVATGFVAGGFATGLTHRVLKETGVDDLLDDIFGF